MNEFNISIGSNGKIGESGGTQTYTQDFIAHKDISLTNFSHNKFENDNLFVEIIGLKGIILNIKSLSVPHLHITNRDVKSDCQKLYNFGNAVEKKLVLPLLPSIKKNF